MENMEQESGLTLGEVFKVIFIKKWLLLAITLSITIIGALFMNFVIGSNQIVYKSNFSIIYPGIEKSVYPDGTPFNYNELISLSNLVAIKNGNEKFVDVDVSAMAQNNDIILQQNKKTVNDEEVSDGTYTISVKSKYFKDSSIATSFIMELASYPIEYVQTSVEKFDFKENLRAYEQSNSYKNQIDYLVAQKNLILDGYQSLIKEYGEMFKINSKKMGEEKKLGDFMSDVKLFFNNNNIELLYTELTSNGFIKDKDYLDVVQSEINTFEEEYDNNAAAIKDLQTQLKELVAIYGENVSSIVTYESFNSRIAALTERNSLINKEIKDRNKYFENNQDGSQDTVALNKFLDKLKNHNSSLTQFTETFASVSTSVYQSVSKLTFLSSSIIVSEGGVNLIVSIVGSLIIGFIIGCIVNLILDMPKHLRKKKETIKITNETEV